MGFLRLFLAFSVVLGHTWQGGYPYTLTGAAAVQCFYVISGYYMAMILEEKYQSAIGTFYLNRALRIWPSYLFALFLSIFYLSWLCLNTGLVHGPFVQLIYLHQRFSPGTWVFWIFSSIFLLGQDLSGLFHLDPTGHMIFSFFSANSPGALSFDYFISQASTLAIELAFYGMAPWIVRWSNKVLIPVSCLGLIFQTWCHFNENWLGAWVGRMTPIDIWTFYWGILAFRLSKKSELKWIRNPWIGLAFAVFLLSYRFIPLNPAILLALIAVFSALSIPSLAFHSEKIPGNRISGEFSYPLYLIHNLAIWIAIDVHSSFFGIPAMAIALSFLLASLILILIERPMEVVRRDVAKSAKA